MQIESFRVRGRGDLPLIREVFHQIKNIKNDQVKTASHLLPSNMIFANSHGGARAAELVAGTHSKDDQLRQQIVFATIKRISLDYAPYYNSDSQKKNRASNMDFYQPVVPVEPVAPLNSKLSKPENKEPFPNWTSWNLLSPDQSCSQGDGVTYKTPLSPQWKIIFRQTSRI